MTDIEIEIIKVKMDNIKADIDSLRDDIKDVQKEISNNNKTALKWLLIVVLGSNFVTGTGIKNSLENAISNAASKELVFDERAVHDFNQILEQSIK